MRLLKFDQSLSTKRKSSIYRRVHDPGSFRRCVDFSSFFASGAAAAMDVALSLLPEVPAALGFFSGSLMCRRRWRQLLDGHEQAFQVWTWDCKIINTQICYYYYVDISVINCNYNYYVDITSSTAQGGGGSFKNRTL